MSHHLDTEAARADGRVDLSDLYVFDAPTADQTVLVMTVNPDAGKSSHTTFRPDAFYDFRIDTNNDWREDVILRIRFGEPDAAGSQSFSVERIDNATGKQEQLGQGKTNMVVPLANGQAWAGLSADPFFANGVGLGAFQQALFTLQSFLPDAFKNGFNLFEGRNVTSIVLEVPSTILGTGVIHVWAVTAITEDERFAQVERIGRPLIQPFFNFVDEKAHAHNQGEPIDDLAQESEHIAEMVTMITRLAKSVADPTSYGEFVAARLLPDVLTYQLGTPAGYTFAAHNGRRLTDDVMDVTLSLVSNTPLSDHVVSDNHFRAEFPYLAIAHIQPEEMLSLKAMLLGQ